MNSYNEDTYNAVMCRICGASSTHLSRHIQLHHNLQEYKEVYPDAPLVSQAFKDKMTGDNNPSKRQEVNKKKSESLRGERNPMYGKQHSEETRKKMSRKQCGENHPMYGKQHSEETKKKISNSRRGKLLSEDNPMYGKHHSEETKKKIAKGRGDISGVHNPMYGNSHTKETKDYLGHLMADRLSKGSLGKRTKIEHICENILIDLDIPYTSQHRVGKVVFDFCIHTKEGVQRYIECNGDYWHAHPLKYGSKVLKDPQIRSIERDKNKLSEFGVENILWLWESDLLHQPHVCKLIISGFFLGDTSILSSLDYKGDAYNG